MTSTTASSAGRRGQTAASPKAHSFWRLLRLNRPQAGRILLALLCVVLVNTAVLAKPYILKIVIDDFLTRHAAQRGLYSLAGMGALYFAAVALSGFFGVAQVNLINKAGQEVMRGLRGSVFRIIQFLPLRVLDKTSAGGLITRATNDVEALSELYTDILISLFKDVVLLVSIVAAMLWMNVQLTLVSFLVIPVMLTVIFLLRTTIKRNFAKMKRLIGRINGFMAERLSGMRLIQIFHAEKEQKTRFDALNAAYYKASSFQVWMNSFLKPASTVFQNLAIALLLWYGMGRIAGGALEIGVLYAFTAYIRQFFDPVSDLADNYTSIQSAFVSAERIFELLDRDSQTEDLDAGAPLERVRGEIEFRHVWFAYEDADWVLKDVSFHIRPGQTAAFVGPTGAGKSTVISLVSGFYTAQKGKILVDGVDIAGIRKRDLRRNIAVVLQDVFLFSDTVRANITLGDDIDDSAVEEAVRASYAGAFVDALPGGLDGPVMERGSTFSAGQRQLLSFARAIAHDPAVIVLDEATANIDTQTETVVQKAVRNLAKDRTTLVIAHRLSTIRDADRIFVLQNGRITQAGAHRELMEQSGVYREMVLEGMDEGTA